MKGLIFTIICATLNIFIATAQGEGYAALGFVKQEIGEFSSVEIDAPANIVFYQIEADTKPYIEYNTYGNYTSKFAAELAAGGVLKISERVEAKREDLTDVRVYFHSLNELSISKANVTIEGTLSTRLLNIFVSNSSQLSIDIDVLDVMVDVSGKSVVKVSGETLYQSANISTAQYDASGLECVSTVISASHNAVAKVDARERLEAKTSTGGTIYYKSEPVIFRSETTLFGGSISLL